MKCLTTLLLIFIYVSTANSFAQKIDESLKETFLDAEYFLIIEDYNEALANYMKLYKRGFQENGNINYRIGQCYLKLPSEKEKAITYLEKAVQYCNAKYQEGVLKESNAPLDAYFYLGMAYRLCYQFDKAINCFEKYKSFYNKQDTEHISFANQEIESCKFASSQMLKSQNVFTVKLDRPVSTNNSDIYPVVAGDMNSIVYTSKLKFYDALFYSRKQNGKWSLPVNITPQVQSDGDQYPTFLSYDGDELYLRKEDNFEADLMVSKKNKGVWTKSKSLGKNINSKYWEGNMCVSKDGNTIFFSSNRKDGIGLLDIYKSTRQANGDWGVPVNLGSKINTSLNEDAPYITEDGTRLYFISQGHQNMGGYDIFFCNISEKGELSAPIHMDYPISTVDDDLYFYPLKNGEIAYTALTQKGNLGYEDIFEIHFNISNELVSAGSNVEEKVVETEVPQQKPLFAMTDVESIPIMVKPAEKSDESSEKNNEIPIILPTIFFEFNSFELSENGKKSLDYIATVFKNYDDLKIEFTGHTDALGSPGYNMILSVKRALSAKEYLVSKGVKSEAIFTKGMGEKVFIAVNKNFDGSDNPEGRKFNRRVEIRILEKMPDTKIIIEDVKIPQNLKATLP